MNLILLLQALGVLFTLILFHNQWLARVHPKNSKTMVAPQPAGAWPVLGHLPLLSGAETLARKFGAMADAYGPVFMLRLGMNRTLVVSSWEIAKECFTTNDKTLASRPSSAAGEYVCYNYAAFGIAPYGPFWRELRGIAVHKLLSNTKVESLKHVRTTVIDKCINELYGLWVDQDQQPITVEMKQWFEDLAFNVIITMIAGKRYCNVGPTGEGEADRVQRAVREMAHHLGVFVPSDSFPFLKWFDFQGYKRAMKQTAKEMDSVAVRWVEEHRRRRLSREESEEEDFIDVMVRVMEDVNLHGHDPDTVIKATSLTLTTAGTDTTAISMTWALSLLLNNRHVLKKAQDELDVQVGKDHHVDESDIKNLVYLQAIVKESMRLYPAAPLSIPHEATEDCSIGGFHVPAGTRLLVNLWKLQRDPRVWSDPCEFQPERFLTSHTDVDVRGQCFQYIPFGSGRRSCPGISLALHVMHLTLARLLHGFELGTPSGAPVDMTEGSSISLSKEGPVQVLLTPRLPPHLYQEK